MVLWRVIISSSRWDQKKFEKDLASRPESRRLAQSKGTRPMKERPKRGDEVVFVTKRRIVMRGYVDSDGFVYGTDHREHSCILGNTRPHVNTDEFAWIKITEFGLSEEIENTGQRTWVKLEN